MAAYFRRRGREVEGTPLLREHTAYTRIEGSNPSVSASIWQAKALFLQGFCFSGFFVLRFYCGIRKKCLVYGS